MIVVAAVLAMNHATIGNKMMNIKNLLVLTALMCIAPSVAPNKPEDTCSSCQSCQPILAAPLNPHIKPTHLYHLEEHSYGQDVLMKIFEQNCNDRLRAHAAHVLARINAFKINLSAGGTPRNSAISMEFMANAKIYFTHARNLYLTLPQDSQTIELLEICNRQILSFTDMLWGAKQQLLKLVTAFEE